MDKEIVKEKEVSIMLGMPTMKMVNYLTVASLLSLGSKHLKSFSIMDSCLVHISRKHMINDAIKNGNTHIFFMDSDMTVPKGAIDRLLSHDVDIVSMMAFKRQAPFSPCFYASEDINGYIAYENYEKDSLVEVLGTGMAATLINLRVFEKVNIDKCFEMGKNGEDLTFCENARREGFKIWVDTGLVTGHVDLTEVTDKHFLQYKSIMEESRKNVNSNDDSKK